MPVFADNKKARFNYEILETFEAGMILSGPEVKSIRASRVSFTNAYILILGDKPVLRGLHISPYGFADNRDYNPEKDRYLLLNAIEIKKIKDKIDQKSLSVVPLNLHSKKGLIKCEIALVQGKKMHDKRQVLKNRTMDREANRAIKNYK
jgi:SsrA-binding protein